MTQLEKNTVAAENQLKTDETVFFENRYGKGKRILFVGNSITLHGYKAEIGWYGENYGMAASCKEKDYVHLVMSEIKKESADAAICIAQAADWERDYKNGRDQLQKYSAARDFAADIVIIRLAENCPWKNFDKEAFYREYVALIEYFDIDGTAKLILTTSFWKHPADEAIIGVGKDKNIPVVYLGDLGESEKMKALGLYEHSGVANHPGDIGMREIADRLLCKIRLISRQ